MTGPDNEFAERLSRLEETVFFQERLLGELNAALTGQQRQLDAMERAVQEVRGQIEEIRLLLDADGGAINSPPPHYL